MAKNLDNVRIENQDLKIKVHELNQQLSEIQGEMKIFKEDYTLMKNTYESKLDAKFACDIEMKEGKPISLDATTEANFGSDKDA